MDILLLGQYYYDDQEEYLKSISKNGISAAHQKLQTNICAGLRNNGNQVTLLSVLPLGNFPFKSNVFYSRGCSHPNGGIEIDTVNLPCVKHIIRERRVYSEITKWIKGDASSKSIIIYDLYLPFLRAAVKAKKKFGINVFVVVPDIPGKLNVEYDSYDRITRFYKDNQADAVKRLIKYADGAFLLTKYMAEVLEITDKPWIVVEGMVEGFKSSGSYYCDKTFLYSGQLNEQVGVRSLMTVWDLLPPDYKLYICGSGELEKEILTYASDHSNVEYLGFLGRDKMNGIEEKVSCYINPRKSSEEYTRYSFPSKTLEYLRTGKPVIAYKLDGIPEDYDDLLFYPDDESPEALAAKIRNMSDLNTEQLASLREKQRVFVETKSSKVQCARMMSLIESVHLTEQKL